MGKTGETQGRQAGDGQAGDGQAGDGGPDAAVRLNESFTGIVRAPVYLQVAEQLREAIFDGRLSPGQPLPSERELAESFGASRASIREALRALQAQGLIIGGGAPGPAVVAHDLEAPARDALTAMLRLNQVELDDLLDLRCLLEMSALERASARQDRARLDDAREALEVMEGEEVSIETFDEADVRFHVALVRASGNEAMHLVMLALRDPVAVNLLEALRAQNEPRRTLRRLTREHAAILDAVEEGKGDRAATLVERHIRRFYTEVGKAADHAESIAGNRRFHKSQR
ncbi:MAG: FadR/GntR family transcriptional regulator [Solirubrobacterales bacterium]